MTKQKIRTDDEKAMELVASLTATFKEIGQALEKTSQHIQMVECRLEVLENYVKLNLENKSKTNYIG